MTPAPPGFHPHPDPTDLTPFQQAVVDVVTTLREGEVATYAEVADDEGRPTVGAVGRPAALRLGERHRRDVAGDHARDVEGLAVLAEVAAWAAKG